MRYVTKKITVKVVDVGSQKAIELQFDKGYETLRISDWELIRQFAQDMEKAVAKTLKHLEEDK